jgi:hypothetical protein
MCNSTACDHSIPNVSVEWSLETTLKRPLTLNEKKVKDLVDVLHVLVFGNSAVHIGDEE